ncbi:MAG: hypothetical protein Q4C46_12510 [Bacillota bacterium]|nr:hypothetical protein [Bacillota bacterium]
MRTYSNAKMIGKQANAALGYFTGMDASMKQDILSMRLKSCTSIANCDAAAASYVSDITNCKGYFSANF